MTGHRQHGACEMLVSVSGVGSPASRAFPRSARPSDPVPAVGVIAQSGFLKQGLAEPLRRPPVPTTHRMASHKKTMPRGFAISRCLSMLPTSVTIAPGFTASSVFR